MTPLKTNEIAVLNFIVTSCGTTDFSAATSKTQPATTAIPIAIVISEIAFEILVLNNEHLPSYPHQSFCLPP
jgi:hypothetical protein